MNNFLTPLVTPRTYGHAVQRLVDEALLVRQPVRNPAMPKSTGDDIDGSRPFFLQPAAMASWLAAQAYVHTHHQQPVHIDSGFRGLRWQRDLFLKHLRQSGDFAKTIGRVAPPGQSEHHTGLAIDVLGDLVAAATHLPLFGWYLSFPDGNQYGVRFEPWHWRYVGAPVIRDQLDRNDLSAAQRQQAENNLLQFGNDDYSEWFTDDAGPAPHLPDQLAELQSLLNACGVQAAQSHGLASPAATIRSAMAHFGRRYTVPSDLPALLVVLKADTLLCLGDAGEPVHALQTRLYDLGYLDTRPSGTFRQHTMLAVKLFQRAMGLAPTGAGDSATLRALHRCSLTALTLADPALLAQLTQGQWLGATPVAPLTMCSSEVSRVPNNLLPVHRSVADVQTLMAMSKAFAATAQTGHLLCDQAPAPLLPQIAYLQIENTHSGLVRLAQYAKRQSNARVLAVTGSSGKTSTKEMLRTALTCQGLAYARRGTGNGIRHVAEGLINTPLAARWSVFECGLGADSAPIRRQSALLQPDVAVVTSIFPAHFAGYSSMQELVRYKLDMAAHLKPDGVLLLDADSPYHALCCDIAAELRVGQLLRFGRSPASNLRIEFCQLALDGTRLALNWQGIRYKAHVPMIGDHWAAMVAAVAGVLAALQVDVQQGLDALTRVNVPAGRGNILRQRVAGGEIIAFDSHYNANPGSMAADLAAFGQLCALHPMLRPIAVIGEYKELGELSAQAHRELGELLAQMPFHRILLVGGSHDDTLSALAACPVDVFATAEDALAVLGQLCRAGDLLFIKGSNANNLVQIGSALAKLSGEG